MGRRPENNDNEVSLFPFLSILTCVIGVLTLMIATLALTQMDNDVVAAAEEFERVNKDLEKQEAQLANLQVSVDAEKSRFEQQASQKQKQQAELQKRLESIRLERLAAQKKRDELEDQPESEQALLKQPMEEIEKELAQHLEEIAQLMKQLEERNLVPEEAEFTVLPGGSGIGIKPYFIECTKTDIVLHRKTGQIRIRADKIETDANLVQLFDEVAGDALAKVIFLIREDGLPVWNRVRKFADSLDVSNGKLPVIGQGRINLNQFLNK